VLGHHRSEVSFIQARYYRIVAIQPTRPVGWCFADGKAL
jgi:hypothetical protein